jgi:SAM-dependent methyltransferase
VSNVFDAYSRYYDLLYREKDYAAEADYVARLLRAHGAGTELPEFGCGTGEHARLLAAHGYQVLGIDRSAQMIAHAEQVESLTHRFSTAMRRRISTSASTLAGSLPKGRLCASSSSVLPLGWRAGTASPSPTERQRSM